VPALLTALEQPAPGSQPFASSDAKVLPNQRSDSTFTTFDGNYPPQVTPRRG
jgi:hypothetical protein